MRATRLARVIYNSTPAHLTLDEWVTVIEDALSEIITPDDMDDPDADTEIKTNLDPSDPNP